MQNSKGYAELVSRAPDSLRESLVHYNKIISKTCSVVFNVPTVHKIHLICFEIVHFSIKSSPILAQCPVERFVLA